MTQNQQSISSSPRLGANHGYRFDGDFAHLSAELVFDDGVVAAAPAWALQLWACAEADGRLPLNGVKVAELPLGDLGSAAAGVHVVSGVVPALPPAGGLDHVMVLALASGDGGGFGTIHDSATYPCRESFVQPRFEGDVRCDFTAGQVRIQVGGITNPRSAENLSGTLVLEIWSLDDAYQGNQWTGEPVASAVLGTLAGQAAWSAWDLTVPAVLPPEPGHLTLMLREWTSTGYVTREYRSIAAPAVTQAPAVPATQPMPPAATPAKAEAAAAKVKVEPKAAPAKAESKAASTKAGLVSVNRAAAAELLAVKGLGAAVVQAIIAGRPYAALDDLCRVKGMGPKLLAKVGAFLSL